MLRLSWDKIDTRHTFKQQPVTLCKSQRCVPFIEMRAYTYIYMYTEQVRKIIFYKPHVLCVSVSKNYRLFGSYYSWLATSMGDLSYFFRHEIAHRVSITENVETVQRNNYG